MYDETFHDYYASRQLKADVEFKKTYDLKILCVIIIKWLK